MSAGKLGVRVIVRAGVVCRRLHASEVCYAVSRMSTPSMMTQLLHQRGVVAPHEYRLILSIGSKKTNQRDCFVVERASDGEI